MSHYAWQVHSTTQYKKLYWVTVEWDPPRVYCECQGYRTHGYCRHIKMYKRLVDRILAEKPDLIE